MKLFLVLRSDKSIDLPIDYNHLIQSWIYQSINKELSTFLHNKGFVVNGRSFKLFCFSRLMGNFSLEVKRQRIFYEGAVKLVITSPLKTFIEQLANGILLNRFVRLGGNELMVEHLNVSEEVVVEDEIVANTLSPVTLYSTLLRMDGRKYTAYFVPRDPEYDELATMNLAKKFYAARQEEDFVQPQNLVRVYPLGRGKINVVRYKGIIIKGYSGRLRLSGSAYLLQTAVNCGLGSKNSQGFGCIEIDRRC